MNVHALFPISVSNRLFTTSNVTAALSKLPSRVSHVTFLIADWLQLYNRATNCGESMALGDVIRDYKDRNKDLINRQRWIANFLEASPDILSASPKIVGMEQYFDPLYAHTFRNINILRSVDAQFRQDVTDAASLFLGSSSRAANSVSLNLSEQYILEEIALNIRLRVKEGLEEEYYLGNYHIPMLKVYANCYSASVFDLLGGEVQHPTKFLFYSMLNVANGSWVQVEQTC